MCEDESILEKIAEGRNKLKQYSERILLLPYTSIYVYLEGIISLKQIMPNKSILIFCAAVSDFIPEEVAEHKIQTQTKLSINLVSSPKILGKMVSENHLCVSFKLETNP